MKVSIQDEFGTKVTMFKKSHLKPSAKTSVAIA